MSNRADVLEANLRTLFREHDGRVPAGLARSVDLAQPVNEDTTLTGHRFLDLLETLYVVRRLDVEARALKDRDEGYYTIASAGHEVNAAVAAALRPTDPAFLHYRSGGFFVERARQVPGQTPIFDILLSLTASADDPISGGRHKVFGSIPLVEIGQLSVEGNFVTLRPNAPDTSPATSAFTFIRDDYLRLLGPTEFDFNLDGTPEAAEAFIELQRR